MHIEKLILSIDRLWIIESDTPINLKVGDRLTIEMVVESIYNIRGEKRYCKFVHTRKG